MKSGYSKQISSKLQRKSKHYIYVSKPKVLSSNSSAIKSFLRTGSIQKLEKLMNEGHGYQLIGARSLDPKINSLLKAVPFYLARIDMLHEAVINGNLREVKVLMKAQSPANTLLKGKIDNLALSKDQAGVGLLHKAVHYDYPEIVEWLIDNYPSTIHVQDKLRRIPLHYVSSCKEPNRIWTMLINAGSNSKLEDVNNKTPEYYFQNKIQIKLPNKPSSNESECIEATSIKSSNIRIWIHDQDVKHLLEIIWEGYGEKLLTETSNKQTMKNFLNTVPYVMRFIQKIHTSAIKNDVNSVEKYYKYPVPVAVLRSKDKNGVTPLHKAAGLNNISTLEYILQKCPEAIHVRDNAGRTSLHYAASFRNNAAYDKLLQAGANENIIDKKGRTARFYKSKQGDIDEKLLKEIPSAPRSDQSDVLPSFIDWSVLNTDIKNSYESTKAASKNKIASKESTVSKKNLVTESNATEDSELSFDGNIENNINNSLENENNPLLSNKISIFIESDEYKEINQPSDEYTKDISHTSNSSTQSTNSLDNYNCEDTSAENLISVEKPKSSQENLHFDKNKDNENIELNSDGKVDSNELLDVTTSPSNVDSNVNVTDHIKDSIKKQNVDELAELVLQGYGDLLLYQITDDEQLQRFINNVPIYLRKIELIHHCCEIGNLDELKIIIDRRKFAVAKEGRTNLFLTPLHMAVLNNHPNIVKYLATRFPETLKVTDQSGRTALHYASFLPDGFIYNLLLTLGADKTVKDNDNNSAKHYYDNKNSEMCATLIASLTGNKPIKSEEVKIGEALEVDLSKLVRRKSSNSFKFLADNLYSYQPQTKDQENKNTKNIETNQEISNDKSDNDGVITQGNIDVTTAPGETAISDQKKEENLFTNEYNLIIDYEGKLLSNDFHPLSRNEHGQTSIHLIASKQHVNKIHNKLFQILHELDADVSHRDELYRTARDVSLISNLYYNVAAIDEYVLHLAGQGKTNRLFKLLLNGYDHLIDLESDQNIFDAVKKRGKTDTLKLLEAIPVYQATGWRPEEEHLESVRKALSTKEINKDRVCNLLIWNKREELHKAIRRGSEEEVKQIFENCGKESKIMALIKNDTNRCSLHISVLIEHVGIVAYIANKFPETVNVGDNLERTALHYAMGLKSVDSLSRILILAGANKYAKDLKGYRPSFYFLNNDDILCIKKEEILISKQ